MIAAVGIIAAFVFGIFAGMSIWFGVAKWAFATGRLHLVNQSDGKVVILRDVAFPDLNPRRAATLARNNAIRSQLDPVGYDTTRNGGGSVQRLAVHPKTPPPPRPAS